MSVAELLQDVGAIAGGLTFVWAAGGTAANRVVSVGVTAEGERRLEPGIGFVVRNRSPRRSVTLQDVEVLFRDRAQGRKFAQSVGPFASPGIPKQLDVDARFEAWIPLRALDETSGREPDFSKPVRIRAKLPPHRDRTSRRFRLS